MRKVKVVTAFIPLKVKHMSEADYMERGDKMLRAAGNATFFNRTHKLTDCWSHDLCHHLPPATDTPADRYETPEDHVNSHIVQHTRTQWALEAVKMDPTVETIIWLDLGILKQGAWNGNQLTPDHVSEFVDRVALYKGDDIPFPGIEGPKPVDPFGNNWRFCGSTHIWPVKYLKQIDRSYRANLINFVTRHKKVPLDLTIWPLVEQNSGLPFKWYKAEYDHTQLTGFPRV